jgi:hypothetical protein
MYFKIGLASCGGQVAAASATAGEEADAATLRMR